MPIDDGTGILPDVPSAPYKRLRSDWREVLQDLMKKRGFNKRRLSQQSDLHETVVSTWLRKPKDGKKQKEPSFHSLAKVAGTLRVSLDVFTDSTNEAPNTDEVTLLSDVRLRSEEPLVSVPSGSVRVVGIIQAGAWLEPSMLNLDDVAIIPLIPDPLFVGLEQMAWKVVGSHANGIAGNGSYVIGVPIQNLPFPVPEKAPVVCIARRGDMSEYTAKRVHYQDGRLCLRNDTDDPRFRELAPGDKPEATHLIIGVYSPVIF